MGHVVQGVPACDSGLTPGQFRRDSPTLDQGGVPMVSSPPNPLVGRMVPVGSQCAVDSVVVGKTRFHRVYCGTFNIRRVVGVALAERGDYLLSGRAAAPRGIPQP